MINSTFPSFILVAMICLRCCMILISRSHSSNSLFSCRDAFTYTGHTNRYKKFSNRSVIHLQFWIIIMCITNRTHNFMQTPCDRKTTLENNLCNFILCWADHSGNQLTLFPLSFYPKQVHNHSHFSKYVALSDDLSLMKWHSNVPKLA